jgi:hypothetical protein
LATTEDGGASFQGEDWVHPTEAGVIEPVKPMLERLAGKVNW